MKLKNHPAWLFKIKCPWWQSARFSQAGYGMALLMIFLASTLLMASSLSLMLAPNVANQVGNAFVNNSIAKQLAMVALDAAESDISSKLTAGTTVNTSYRYPASGTLSVTSPSYPGSGSTLTVGNYYVTITMARGFTYLLKTYVTVNSVSYSYSRILQISTSPSAQSKAVFAYSLRKVIPSYSGYAVKVRCGAGTGQDIGFTGSGDFDMDSLKSCLGDSQLPLDLQTGAKLAYGLRKLRAAYSGAAIKVRSNAAGNPTQDIGFDSNGDLDVVSLKSFVGSNSGYIDTWYDQSVDVGGKHLQQSTLSAQPTIVEAGVVNMQNNTPSIHFVGSSQQYLSSAISGFLNTANITSFIVGEVQNTSADTGKIAVLQKNGDTPDYFSTGSMQLLSQVYQHTDQLNNYSNGEGNWGSQAANNLFQGTTVKSGGSSILLYLNDTVGSNALMGGGNSKNTISPDYLIVGGGRNNTTVTDFFTGYVNELIVYNSSSITSTKRKSIQSGEGHYYRIPSFRDGFIMVWYDQTGNGADLTQGTNSNQPSLDMTGINPAVFFEGDQEYIENTAANRTTATLNAFIVSQIDNPADATLVPANGRIITLGKNGDSYDWNSINSTALLGKYNTNLFNARNSDLTMANTTLWGVDFQTTVLFDGVNRTLREMQNGTFNTASTTNDATGNLIINKIRMGAPFATAGAHEYFRGRVNEMLFVPQMLSISQYQNFESDQQNYYQVK